MDLANESITRRQTILASESLWPAIGDRDDTITEWATKLCALQLQFSCSSVAVDGHGHWQIVQWSHSAVCRHCLLKLTLIFVRSFLESLLDQPSPVVQQTSAVELDWIQADRQSENWPLYLLLCSFIFWKPFLPGSENKFDFMSQLKVHYHTSCWAVQVLHSCSQ